MLMPGVASWGVVRLGMVLNMWLRFGLVDLACVMSGDARRCPARYGFFFMVVVRYGAERAAMALQGLVWYGLVRQGVCFFFVDAVWLGDFWSDKVIAGRFLAWLGSARFGEAWLLSN